MLSRCYVIVFGMAYYAPTARIRIVPFYSHSTIEKRFHSFATLFPPVLMNWFYYCTKGHTPILLLHVYIALHFKYFACANEGSNCSAAAQWASASDTKVFSGAQYTADWSGCWAIEHMTAVGYLYKCTQERGEKKGVSTCKKGSTTTTKRVPQLSPVFCNSTNWSTCPLLPFISVSLAIVLLVL